MLPMVEVEPLKGTPVWWHSLAVGAVRRVILVSVVVG